MLTNARERNVGQFWSCRQTRATRMCKETSKMHTHTDVYAHMHTLYSDLMRSQRGLSLRSQLSPSLRRTSPCLRMRVYSCRRSTAALFLNLFWLVTPFWNHTFLAIAVIHQDAVDFCWLKKKTPFFFFYQIALIVFAFILKNPITFGHFSHPL